MATTDIDRVTARAALDLIEELIAAQRARVLEQARRIRPGMTEDDLRSAPDLAEVQADPGYRYEEGQLAGLVSARIALQARLVGRVLPS
jgi:hypothetical protein